MSKEFFVTRLCASNGYTILEYADDTLTRRCSGDDAGFVGQWLIDEAINTEPADRSTVQQILTMCRIVNM